MPSLFLKILFFVLLVAVIGTFNGIFQNDLAVQNLQAELQQIKGGPRVTGDFQIAGYWIPFSVVYIVECVLLAYVSYKILASEAAKAIKGVKHEQV